MSTHHKIWVLVLKYNKLPFQDAITNIIGGGIYASCYE